MPCLEGSPKCALPGTILLRRVRCRPLSSDPEVVAKLHERMVCVLSSVVTSKCSGNPMPAMKRFTTARMAAAVLSRVPYGRWRREALSTNITTYRDPPRTAGKGPAVSMWISSIGLVARAVVCWAVGARFPFAIEHAEHETSCPVKRKSCCLAVACKTLTLAWRGRH